MQILLRGIYGTYSVTSGSSSTAAVRTTEISSQVPVPAGRPVCSHHHEVACPEQEKLLIAAKIIHATLSSDLHRDISGAPLLPVSVSMSKATSEPRNGQRRGPAADLSPTKQPMHAIQIHDAGTHLGSRRRAHPRRLGCAGSKSA